MLQDSDLLALQEVRTKVDAAYGAFQKFRAFSQEQVDAIVEAMAEAARQHAGRLAELAVSETGYGNARDKLAKNLLAADLLARKLRGMKTIGVLRECSEKQVVEIGVPMGVIAAILPTTNPTSTAIYKILISLKAGNSVVLSPHPRAKKCSCETAEVLAQAANAAGAPDGIIQCVSNPTIESTNELMRHRRTAAILSTGGSGMVRAAYSSGKPAFGVGPGNVPVVIDTSANVRDAVAKIVSGKSFDYGTLCSSEQIIIAQRSIRDAILEALVQEKAYICNEAQQAALTKILLVPPKWGVNPDCVGQSAPTIAKMAGFEVPPDTRVLAAEINGVGPEHPLSAEKLSPVLSLLFVKGWPSVLDSAEAVLKFNGLGHTCGIYSTDETRTREYALRMPAMRVLCNTPTPQGSVGITTNLQPAMTLGCGAIAGNITGDNIGPKHLINIKRLAYSVRTPEEAFPLPKDTSFSSFTPPTGNGAAVKSQITAAVERFLTERGVLTPAASKNPAERVVDRFLSTRKQGVPSTPAQCALPNQPPGAGETPEPKASDTPAQLPEKPAVSIVDFVSEHDVRVAVSKSVKIYIGPKTIVTPLARDLASQHDTLVVAQQ
ncbi:MAG TPA: aldehyde dehydrogenase family protein [Bryobacteraceae bacterium]|nr:aldehyde dehydrogenase family protein [Bryobacteraceae bacterium]